MGLFTCSDRKLYVVDLYIHL
jgi:hypothetical protein